MAIESARHHLRRWGRDADIVEFDASTATVALAAAALGCEPARIAKTISLRLQGRDSATVDSAGAAMLVVTAGDVKIDNVKFKATFGFKARMLSPEEALRLTGHAIGGVCPFGVPDGTRIFLDESLRRFHSVFPACGSGNSAIELTCDELAEYSGSERWVDVTASRE